MAFRICQWTAEIVEHLADHDVTPEEFEEALEHPLADDFSDGSGLPAVVAWVRGRLLFCVYRPLTRVDVEPVTAYEIDG